MLAKIKTAALFTFLTIIFHEFSIFECSRTSIELSDMKNGQNTLGRIPAKVKSPTDVTKLPSPLEVMTDINKEIEETSQDSICKREIDDDYLNSVDSDCMFYMSMPKSFKNSDFLHKYSPTSLNPIVETKFIESNTTHGPLCNTATSKRRDISSIDTKDEILVKQSPKALTSKNIARQIFSPLGTQQEFGKRSMSVDTIQMSYSSKQQTTDSPFSSISSTNNSKTITKRMLRKKIKCSQPKVEVDYYGFPGFETDDSIERSSDDDEVEYFSDSSSQKLNSETEDENNELDSDGNESKSRATVVEEEDMFVNAINSLDVYELNRDKELTPIAKNQQLETTNYWDELGFYDVASNEGIFSRDDESFCGLESRQMFKR